MPMLSAGGSQIAGPGGILTSLAPRVAQQFSLNGNFPSRWKYAACKTKEADVTCLGNLQESQGLGSNVTEMKSNCLERN